MRMKRKFHWQNSPPSVFFIKLLELIAPLHIYHKSNYLSVVQVFQNLNSKITKNLHVEPQFGHLLLRIRCTRLPVAPRLCLLFTLLTLLAHAMRLTPVMVVHNFESKVWIALHKRRPNVGYLVAPAPAVRAKHDVVGVIVLQPVELFEPVGAEATPLAGGGRSSRRRRRCGRLQRVGLIHGRVARAGRPYHGLVSWRLLPLLLLLLFKLGKCTSND